MNIPPPLSPSAGLRRIKRIVPLQAGKILALLYGLMGLLFLPVFLLMSLIASQAPVPERTLMLGMGLGFAVLMPVLYAAMGFVTGLVGAAIYNAVAKWIGGIEIELE